MKTLMKCVCAAIAAVTLATSASADNANSKTNTEAETARTGDLVRDNNLILLDSEILKPQKNLQL
jgi:hypothetical protein